MSAPICAGRTPAAPPGLATLAAVVPAREFLGRPPPYALAMPNVYMSASVTAVAAETIKEKPPSSGSGSGKQLREVDGIVSMCVSDLARRERVICMASRRESAARVLCFFERFERVARAKSLRTAAQHMRGETSREKFCGEGGGARVFKNRRCGGGGGRVRRRAPKQQAELSTY